MVSGDGGVEVEYEVDRILCHKRRRGRGNQIKYLVKWKGVDMLESTWEP